MTAKEAIAQADKIRPNTMPDDMKVELLRELDGELVEMFAADAPPFPPPEPPEEPQEESEDVPTWPEASEWPEHDPVLLMPFPHDGVYIKYLCAQIDLFNMESDVYQNDMVVYNTAMADARAWWRRNHVPRRNPNWKVM